MVGWVTWGSSRPDAAWAPPSSSSCRYSVPLRLTYRNRASIRGWLGDEPQDPKETNRNGEGRYLGPDSHNGSRWRTHSVPSLDSTECLHLCTHLLLLWLWCWRYRKRIKCVIILQKSPLYLDPIFIFTDLFDCGSESFLVTKTRFTIHMQVYYNFSSCEQCAFTPILPQSSIMKTVHASKIRCLYSFVAHL